MDLSNGPHSDAAGPVVCTGCGCYCDDILLPPASRPLSEAGRLCKRGVRYFSQLPGPQTRGWVRGQSVDVDVAIDEAVRLLAAARAPGIVGLELVSVETCTAAMRLAERLRAWLCPWPPDPTRTWGHLAPDLSLSRAEFEQAADLVIYLGTHPDEDQPRHRERHLRRGLGIGRRVLLIEQPSLSEVLALRLHFERNDPLPEPLTPLAEAIRASRCVQLFVGARLAASTPELVTQWQSLAAKERQHRRFGLSLLGATGKGRTASETLTWLTGYPGPINFGPAKPQYRPELGEEERLLKQGAFDLVLWLGLDPDRERFPATDVPQIHLGMQPDVQAAVALQTPGLDPRLDAHVVREDGIMLRLAGGNPGTADPTAALLNRLLEALDKEAS